MAQRKSVKLSTRPVQVAEVLRGTTAGVGGDLIPEDTPLTNAAAGCDPAYGLLAQAVYGTVYALSFGCVFSAMLVGRVLPGQEILSRGIGDGARAAKRIATSMSQQPRRTRDYERRNGESAEVLRTT